MKIYLYAVKKTPDFLVTHIWVRRVRAPCKSDSMRCDEHHKEKWTDLRHRSCRTWFSVRQMAKGVRGAAVQSSSKATAFAAWWWRGRCGCCTVTPTVTVAPSVMMRRRPTPPPPPCCRWTRIAAAGRTTWNSHLACIKSSKTNWN